MDLLSLIENEKTKKAILVPHIFDLPADLETPVSAFLKLRSLGAKFLLESAEGAGTVGRYTFIGLRPKIKFIIYREKTKIFSSDGSFDIYHKSDNKPFTALKRLINRLELQFAPPNVTLLGGLVGQTNYEIISCFEPKLRNFENGNAGPLATFYFVDTLLAFDHFKRRMQVIRLLPNGTGDSSKNVKASIDDIISALNSDIKLPLISPKNTKSVYHSNFEKPEFEKLVRQAKENILDGDIFQVVLSQALKTKSDTDGFQIYRALRMLNPSPYMFYLDMEDSELIGSSPEMLIKLHDGRVLLRPIAGTRPRGESEDQDLEFEKSLRSDEKEKAEHVMLVDLGRNDLGRVCDFGSVKLDRFMETERFSHVMHLTSTVSGTPREKIDQFEIFASAFPAGTTTGAPKVRAMEIIRDLEKQPRGPYAGSVGYFSLSGDMDMCITIRTIIKKKNEITIQAGAGIVADSVPELEYKETINKLQALKVAIENAEKGNL